MAVGGVFVGGMSELYSLPGERGGKLERAVEHGAPNME